MICYHVNPSLAILGKFMGSYFLGGVSRKLPQECYPQDEFPAYFHWSVNLGFPMNFF